MKWHPWDALRQREDIVVHWTDLLPDGVLGATDGGQVWMARGQSQAERRCTLTHELVHIEWDHAGEQTVAVERAVCAEAARRLLPVEDLAREAVWAHDIVEAADDLWVDVDTLLNRLENLDLAERRIIESALAACEQGA